MGVYRWVGDLSIYLDVLFQRGPIGASGHSRVKDEEGFIHCLGMQLQETGTVQQAGFRGG